MRSGQVWSKGKEAAKSKKSTAKVKKEESAEGAMFRETPEGSKTANESAQPAAPPPATLTAPAPLPERVDWELLPMPVPVDVDEYFRQQDKEQMPLGADARPAVPSAEAATVCPWCSTSSATVLGFLALPRERRDSRNSRPSHLSKRNKAA